jgi:hypothetical protein
MSKKREQKEKKNKIFQSLLAVKEDKVPTSLPVMKLAAVVLQSKIKNYSFFLDVSFFFLFLLRFVLVSYIYDNVKLIKNNFIRAFDINTSRVSFFRIEFY